MTGYDEIDHPSHHHRLEMEYFNGTPFRCNGCRQIGSGTRFTCAKGCDFHLHKQCALARDTITHPFFKGCKYTFLPEIDPGRICDACGDDIRGFVYHCFSDECHRDLHPCCADLKNVIEAGDVTLDLKKKMTVLGKCYYCGKKKNGNRGGAGSWAYVSKCKSVQIHIGCVREMLEENWEKKMLGGAAGDGSPNLSIVVRDKRTNSGRSSKFKAIMKVAITFVIAAVIGDPTALVAGIIASLIVH